MATRVRVLLCSAICVEVDGVALRGRDLGSRKARTLLALLTAERGRLVPVDTIVDVLWPDGPPADPAANVSTLVSRTRRLLGGALTSAPGRAHGLVDGDWSTDLDEAAALLDDAAGRRGAGEHGLAAAGSRRALDLLGTQPALVDEADADWVRGVRAEADTHRARARHLLAASLTALEPAAAVAVAAEAVAADPLDERAVRDLMRAQAAAGRTAAALATYDGLARHLRHELGTDPDPSTADLHLDLLRATPPTEEAAPARAASGPTLVGREGDLAVIASVWRDAGDGTGALVLVDGEAGIGKTRLLDAAADLAGSTGGQVLRSRCHPAERSLFLQPYVDALRPALLGAAPARTAALLRGHEDAWSVLLPELRSLVRIGAVPGVPGSAEVQRRQAYDAVAAVLRTLAQRSPVLLALDDLQDAGSATVELLGYLAERLRGARVLVVGAVRAEDSVVVQGLADRAVVVPLGALPRSAVDALAAATGLGQHAAAVMARTAGHTLSVVECLRALAAGDTGVPETLAQAVLARVDRLDPETRDVLSAGAVLGRRLDPRLLAALGGWTEVEVVRRCEELARVRLLVASERGYDFVNDLVQECVQASLPPALAAAYHRRAADLTADQPELMARHAFAAGDADRAAHGWLLAGEAAMRRGAVDDAEVLFDLGVDAAQTSALRARLLIERARAHEAATTFPAALADIDEALRLARAGPDRRLEMTALRARGGDVPMALGRPLAEIADHLTAGLGLAGDLGDRRVEAALTTRLTILEASRLRLAAALARAERGLARARAVGSPDAVVLALDGVKTVLGYLGDAERLPDVVGELEPALRRRDHTWLLQWTVFDAAFVPAAGSDWAAAATGIEEAVAINRRSGYPAYAGYFTAHLGWFDRLAGDLDGALRHGRAALAQTSPVDHPWWYATAAGFLSSTLLELGRARDAAVIARQGLASTGPETPEAYRLRCAAPLAAATGDADDLDAAAALLAGVDCPPGGAWVVGADCYLLLARADLEHHDPVRAERWLAALAPATERHWQPIRARIAALRAQSTSATS